MGGRSTTERLFEQYNTYSRRPTVENGKIRRTVFRSFQRTLGQWLPDDREARIIDVACGEGALLCFLQELGYTDLAGLDVSPENVRICHRLGLTFVKEFDALRLGEFSDRGLYDVVFLLDIVEHLPKQIAAGFLEQARESLKPGGCIIAQTPNMGSILGCFHRYNDLSHEFSLTEKSARGLFMMAGFAPDHIELRPAWNATTRAGYLREVYLHLLHRLVFLAEGARRPMIPTKNLLIRAKRV